MSEDVVVRDLDRPGDLGWVVMRHGELYDAEYGWEVETVTARIVADYATGPRTGREGAWVAEIDGRRVGSVFCVGVDDGTAKLRLLLVDPDARGRHVGSRLVARCVDFARAAGYRRIVLWTNEPLATARRIYLAAGFRLVDEQPHTDFGPELLGQSYALELDMQPEGSLSSR